MEKIDYFKDEWTVQSRKVKRQHADNHDHGAHSDDENEDSFSENGGDGIAHGRRQKRRGVAGDDSGPRGGRGRGGNAARGGSKLDSLA